MLLYVNYMQFIFQCQGGGCLIELVIQLAIIFVGKQLLQNTLMEILLPRIMRKIRLCFGEEIDKAARKKLMPWEKDYILDVLGPRGLYNEYLEMSKYINVRVHKSYGIPRILRQSEKSWKNDGL